MNENHKLTDVARTELEVLIATMREMQPGEQRDVQLVAEAFKVGVRYGEVKKTA